MLNMSAVACAGLSKQQASTTAAGDACLAHAPSAHPVAEHVLPQAERGCGDVLLPGGGRPHVRQAHGAPRAREQLQRVEARAHVALRPLHQRRQRLHQAVILRVSGLRV